MKTISRTRKCAGYLALAIVLLFVVCCCSRQEPKGALPQAAASDCEARIRFRTPPRDYTAWQKAFGSKELDATTEAGRQRLYGEKIRLEVSKVAFTNVLSRLSFAYTNSSECAFRDIQSRIEEILEGFCRENSAAILGVVGKNPSMINPMVVTTCISDGAGGGSLVSFSTLKKRTRRTKCQIRIAIGRQWPFVTSACRCLQCLEF